MPLSPHSTNAAFQLQGHQVFDMNDCVHNNDQGEALPNYNPTECEVDNVQQEHCEDTAFRDDAAQFQEGSHFESRAHVKEKLDELGKKYGFLIRVKNSDKHGYMTLVCTAEGQSQKNLDSNTPAGDIGDGSNKSAHVSARRRSSFRMDCDFSVVLCPYRSSLTTADTVDLNGNYSGPLRVSQSNLKHTGRCKPSIPNLETRLIVRGNNILPHLSEQARRELTTLIKFGHPSTQCIREFLQEKLPPGVSVHLNALVIFNLCKTLQKDIQCHNPADLTVAVGGGAGNETAEAADNRVGTATIRALFFASDMQTGGWAVRQLLMQLRTQDDTFVYNILYDNSIPIAFMFMTSWQRALLEDFGELIFFDAKPSAFNDLRWPFIGPCILDEEHNLRMFASLYGNSDGGKVTKWAFSTFAKFVPSLFEKLTVVVTDAATTQDTISEVFPKAKLVLCNWHIVNDLVTQLSNCSGWAEFKAAVLAAQYTIQTEEEFFARFELFTEPHGFSNLLLVHFKVWYDRRLQWAHFSRKLLFTQGVHSNLAEVINAMYAVLADHHMHTLVDCVKMLLNKVQQEIIGMRQSYSRSFILKGEDLSHKDDSPLVKKLRLEFSDYIVDKFKEQEQQSYRYVVSFGEESTVTPSQNGEITVAKIRRSTSSTGTSDKFREIILKADKTYFCICGHCTQMKSPCRHIQCFCRSQGVMTVEMMRTLIDARWTRRESLRFALSFPGNLELENFLDEAAKTDCAPHELEHGDCNMDNDIGDMGNGVAEMPRAAAMDAGGPEVARAPGVSSRVKGKVPSYNEVLTEMKGVLTAYQSTWQLNGLELFGFMKKLSEHAGRQQSPAMFFTGMEKSLNNITVGSSKVGSSSLSLCDSAMPDNSPLPYHNSGNPRVLRIESAPSSKKSKSKKSTVPGPPASAMPGGSAGQMPIARKHAVQTCRFCCLQGHIIGSCSILKEFGIAVSLERWEQMKAIAPQGSSAVLQIISSMPIHSPFPKEVKHLLIEAVVKTSAFGNFVVKVSGINSLASKVPEFISHWRDGSLVAGFLSKHIRSDEGGRRSNCMVIASPGLTSQNSTFAATLLQEPASSLFMSSEPCAAAGYPALSITPATAVFYSPPEPSFVAAPIASHTMQLALHSQVSESSAAVNVFNAESNRQLLEQPLVVTLGGTDRSAKRSRHLSAASDATGGAPPPPPTLRYHLSSK